MEVWNLILQVYGTMPSVIIQEMQRKKLFCQLNMNLHKHLMEDMVTRWFTYTTVITLLFVPVHHVLWIMDVLMPLQVLQTGVLICTPTVQMIHDTTKHTSPIMLLQTKLKQVVNHGMQEQHYIITPI